METLGDDGIGIGSGGESDKERQEEAEQEAALLRDRLRLSVISMASSHAKTLGMTISEPVVACIADLAFKQAEQMGRDVELFAQHAGRKSVNMEDVILSAHRNEHLMGLLRDFAQELKGKEPCTERKRTKKALKNENKVQEPIEMLD
ncbi:Centromere protein S [Rhynchospora pubera]|uniref:Centromere protein S n=1 Tax=Rhynchospora pubera TaxID=906938 RepID=A0AAV8D7G8_9POAL|nr:Centromere protein S [Rhynchospora pubera]